MHDLTSNGDTGRVVRVLWIDSGMAQDNGWKTMSETTEGLCNDLMSPVETVGLYVAEDEHILAVAQSVAGINDGHYHSIQAIYKPNIVDVKFLTEPDKKIKVADAIAAFDAEDREAHKDEFFDQFFGQPLPQWRRYGS